MGCDFGMGRAWELGLGQGRTGQGRAGQGRMDRMGRMDTSTSDWAWADKATTCMEFVLCFCCAMNLR